MQLKQASAEPSQAVDMTSVLLVAGRSICQDWNDKDPIQVNHSMSPIAGNAKSQSASHIAEPWSHCGEEGISSLIVDEWPDDLLHSSKEFVHDPSLSSLEHELTSMAFHNNAGCEYISRTVTPNVLLRASKLGSKSLIMKARGGWTSLQTAIEYGNAGGYHLFRMQAHMYTVCIWLNLSRGNFGLSEYVWLVLDS